MDAGSTRVDPTAADPFAGHHLDGDRLEFALAAVVPDLGFSLAGSDPAEDALPGVQQISSGADVLLALGTVPWQETTSEPTLSTLPIPVVAVPLDAGQPSAGPLTSPALLERCVTALRTLA